MTREINSQTALEPEFSLMVQFPDSNHPSKRKSITKKLIQRYLDEGSNWSDTWGLKFNPSKCECVIIGNKRKDVDLNLFLYGDKE